MSKQPSIVTAIVVLALGTTAVSAAVTTIDFDSFAPGVYPTTFLAAQGIPDMTIGGSGPGAGGPQIFAATAPMSGESPPNVFFQQQTSLDSGQSHSLTMTFAPELTAFSLNRIGVTPGSGSSTPEWSATFFDAGGGNLGSIGEGTWQFNPAPQIFSFTAPAGQTIASMRLESIWTVTTFRNIVVDDFVLTQVDLVPAASPVGILVAVVALSSLLLLTLLRRAIRSETRPRA